MRETFVLDVSDLEPPEPLSKVIATLQGLPGGRILQVRHRREPHPLYGMLAEMGFAYRCQQRANGAVTLYIWPQDDTELANLAANLDDHAY